MRIKRILLLNLNIKNSQTIEEGLVEHFVRHWVNNGDLRIFARTSGQHESARLNRVIRIEFDLVNLLLIKFGVVNLNLMIGQLAIIIQINVLIRLISLDLYCLQIYVLAVNQSQFHLVKVVLFVEPWRQNWFLRDVVLGFGILWWRLKNQR